jgi:hypothetical protein
MDSIETHNVKFMAKLPTTTIIVSTDKKVKPLDDIIERDFDKSMKKARCYLRGDNGLLFYGVKSIGD